MSIYQVATPAVGDAGSQVVHLRYSPSETQARKARRELAEAHGLKLDEVMYKAIDVKPGKAGLIAYLNSFHAQVPASYVAEGYPDVKKSTAKKKV